MACADKGKVMDKKKERVLIVHNYYQIPGGEDTVVANDKRLLEDHGHIVALYTRNNSELKGKGIIRRLFSLFASFFSVKTYRDVRRIIKEQRIDIVHVHNTLCLISPSVYYAALSMNTPVVQTIHNFRLLCPGGAFYRDGHICEDCVADGLGCAVRHRCYRSSRLQTIACVICTRLHRAAGIYGKINYICLTEFNKEKLLNLKQIQEKNVFVKANFTKTINEIIPYDKRQKQYIFAGRLDKLKGIDILLRAWKLLAGEGPKLIICGTGPMESWCKEFIEENKINAEMRGLVTNTEVRKLIGESKALILPTQWYEGFPMVIVEAYSAGTPVICSDMGNAGSVVIEGETGWKYPYDSPEALSSLIKEERSIEIQSIIKHYENNYTENSSYLKTKNIYECITANG